MHEWGAMIGAGAAAIVAAVAGIGSILSANKADKGYGKPFNLDLTHLGHEQDPVAKGLEVERRYSMGENLVGAVERLLKGKGGNHLPRL